MRYLWLQLLKFFIRKITLTVSSSGLFEECKLLPVHLDIFEIVPKRQRQTRVSEVLCGKERGTWMKQEKYFKNY